MKFKPLGGRVVLRPVNEDVQTSSGLWLVEDVTAHSRGGQTAMGKEQPKLPWAKAVVVQTGGERRSKDSTGRDPIFVKVGDKVLYDERGGFPIEFGQEALFVASPNAIKAVLE